MATSAIRLLDSFGRPMAARGNVLHDASRWDRSRQTVTRTDNDFNAIAAGGQRELMSIGRYLCANVAPLQNAIRTIATTAIGDAFIPQYYGRPQGDWGERAENLLYEWHKICVMSGGVFDWQAALQTTLVGIMRDGDAGVLLTGTKADDKATDADGVPLTEGDSVGYPQIQLIPAHRIGSKNEDGPIKSGRFAGNVLSGGVILNPFGRVIGYRITAAEDHRDVSASDMALYYRPDFVDQSRGISQIASGIREWQDRKQAFEYIRMALKKEASYAVIEHTEEGAIDPDAQEITSSTSDTGTIYEERVDGGSLRIFRANTGSKIEFPESTRPSANTQAFWERVTRDGLQALNWPSEFYDASKIGGASLRMMMEVAQRTIASYQGIAQRMATRIDAWRIAKAINDGELPPNPDWWKIAHQCPEVLTADKGYSSQVDREEYKLGFVTMKDIAARRGKWWEEERAQEEAEADDLLTRAARLAAKHSITIEAALSLLQMRSANPPAIMTEPEAPEPETETNNEP